MARKAYEFSYERLPAAALAADEQALLERALAACEQAYAPFSAFRVGAALLLEDGSIFTGNNQENVSFPVGTCAERAVMFYVASQGRAADIRKVAVRARSDKKTISQPVTPCGACRQVMVEYERMAGLPFVVLMQGLEGDVLRLEGAEACLLPFGFDVDF